MKRLELIRKWIMMLKGESSLNVEQGIGKIYSKTELKGYYNDFTYKVKKITNIDSNGVPYNKNSNGKKIYFPIAIAQYGLGLYDLYLLENKEEYLNKFIIISEWLIKNQDEHGGWDNSEGMGIRYSSMAQGEIISLLCRYYIEVKEEEILYKIKKAYNLMMASIELGGTSRYESRELYLEEYPKLIKSVLNGWIFSIFGIFDYYKVIKDEKIKNNLNKTLKTLDENIKLYNIKFWSSYDLKNEYISSPFYHKLHINLLEVVGDIWDLYNVKTTLQKLKKQNKSLICRILAISIKIFQKLKKPGEILIIE